MQAIFIRHAAAEPAGGAGDEARRLTDSGEQQVRTSADAKALRSRLAQVLAAKPQTVGIVGHSPLLDDCIGTLLAARPKIGLSLSKAGAACVDIPDT